MVDPDLAQFIESMKESGFSDEETRKKLLDAGWDQKDVNAALGTGPAPVGAPSQPSPTGNELPVFTVIGNAFNFMTGEFRFWKDFFFALLVLQIAMVIVTGVASFFMIGGVAEPSNLGGMASNMGLVASVVPLLLLSVGVGLVVTIISLIVQLGLLKGVDARLNGKAFTLQEGFSFGTSKLVVAMFALIVSGLLVLLGFICLIIPGIYLIVPLVLIMPAIAIGDKDVGSAISESFRLTKGRWFKSLGMGIAVFLVAMAYGVAAGIVLLPLNLIISLLSHLSPGAALFTSLLSQILQTALTIPLTIFFMVALAMYYRNLRECTPG